MMTGEFNQKGELVFEVSLIAADETITWAEAILDTGFTGWLLVNEQDAITLGWKWDIKPKIVQTAGNKTVFSVYEGILLIDKEEFIIPVLAGYRVKEILLGVRWLRFKRLVADFYAGVLTLG
ncbi:aspartyl protease [[Phormidium] sp. ETS-05]|uniref:aspartyl protease n=1 Tax=[Phormidium] sp. ETS-05 TaxID=222819 RepID=UPI0018EF0B97|nr:aspartyl protease [[Phormidium] sp. ETS-05]